MIPALTIVADGIGRNTKVLDREGRPLSGVCRVEVAPITRDKLVTAKVWFTDVALEIKAHGKPMLPWRYV